MADQKYYVNDEIVNQYLKLITKRSNGTVYAFDTFFFTSLCSKGFPGVESWTKKLDIFSKKKLFVPINVKKVHWILIYINLEKKTIQDFDSLSGNNFQCKKSIFQYLHIEHFNKKQIKFDSFGWTLEVPRSIPKQTNTHDCGVFLCVYAEYLSRDADLNFTQVHIPALRRLINYELIDDFIIDPKILKIVLHVFRTKGINIFKKRLIRFS